VTSKPARTRRTRRTRRGRVMMVLGALVIGIGIACIIPDRDIQVLTTDFNQYPVRFVEGIPLDMAARCACSPDACECPMPRFTDVPTFLDAEDPAYQFCICGDNKVDQRQLPGVVLYVEDQDDVDGEPADSLYAVALLDWDPTSGDSAFDYVAYRSYLDSRLPLPLGSPSSYETLIIKRPRPYVRELTLVDVETQRFDLCNGAGRPVGPGYHTLSFMVTDRMWFQRPGTADADDEQLEGSPVTLDGVPNIAGGATYDIRTYVFHCYEEGDANCGCMEVGNP
jgi:hypothetical protein